MTNPMIFDGQEHRPMTDDEFTQWTADVEHQEQHTQTAEAVKQSARAKFAALGLTDDEINALIP
jgi:hypothetical protein